MTYQYQFHDSKGLGLISCFDPKTLVTVRTAIPDVKRNTASVLAFAGARYSRSNKSAVELIEEANSVDSGAKLASIFRDYGHASVADMATVCVFIENIPQLLGMRFFYESSLGGGQERSTRYQDFSGSTKLTYSQLKEAYGLESGYADPGIDKLQDLSLSLYTKWYERMRLAFCEFFKIYNPSKRELGALTARTFDTCRSFLLTGLYNRTSLVYVTSAREFARLVGVLKADADPLAAKLGAQIEATLAPSDEIESELGFDSEVKKLIRHTEIESYRKILAKLPDLKITIEDEGFKYREDTCEGFKGSVLEKSILQLLQLKIPGAKLSQLQVAMQQCELAKILAKVIPEFNHHYQMDNAWRVNEYSLTLKASIAELRDFNRHRSLGRFCPLLEQAQTLDSSYSLPLYLDIPDFKTLRAEFVDDLEGLFKTSEIVYKLEPRIHKEILPFASSIDYNMHGSLKELNYLIALRSRPGGHVNYRVMSSKILECLKAQEPLLKESNFNCVPVAVDSRKEFFDRS